ncbi:MAG: histidine kinase dimerization/phospho-acceptor domain-containing protein [Bacteroidota bacterium]
MKRFFKLLFEPLVTFFVRYPAVLSGYIIYIYFLLATLEFYQDVKVNAPGQIFGYFQNFDALIWMWLLAWALVKIIEYRSKMEEHRKRELMQKQDLELKQTQLNTMHEVIRSLQHDINNPLTIILAYLRRAEKAAGGNDEILKNLAEVKTGAERIAKTLSDFAKARAYTTINSPVGPLAQPLPHDSARTVDETGAQGS